MSIKVLFFGATAVATGQREIEMSHAVGVPAREIFAQMLNKFPGLASHTLLLSVNQKYSTGSDILSDGDEIAIFTAVSGG